MKKIIAFILSIVLVFTVVQMPAFAEGSPDWSYTIVVPELEAMEIGDCIDLSTIDVRTYRTADGVTEEIESTYTWENLTPDLAVLDDTVLTALETGTVRLAVTNAQDKVANVSITVNTKSLVNAEVSAQVTEVQASKSIRGDQFGVEVVLDGKELVLAKDFKVTICIRRSGSSSVRRTTYPDKTVYTSVWSINDTVYLEIEGMGSYTGVVETTIPITVTRAPVHIYQPDDDLDVELEYGSASIDKYIYSDNADTGEEMIISVDDESVVSVSYQAEEYYPPVTFIRPYRLTFTPLKIGETSVEVYIPEDSDRFYESDRVTLNVTVNPADLSNAVVSGLDEVYQYTGDPVKPETTITVNGLVLEKDVDYSLTYQIDGIDVTDPIGSPSVNTTVNVIATSLNSNLIGTISYSYIIAPIVLEVELEESYPYEIGGVKPEPVVSYNGVVLTLGQDYYLSYTANDTVGEGTGSVTVYGDGAYSGTAPQTYTFDITKKDITDAVVSAQVTQIQTNVSVRGDGFGVSVFLEGTELVLARDFKVTVCIRHSGSSSARRTTYPDSTVYTSAGSVTDTVYLEIAGMGNFTGIADAVIPITVTLTPVEIYQPDGIQDVALQYAYEPVDLYIYSNNADTGDVMNISIADESVVSVSYQAETYYPPVTFIRPYRLTFTALGEGETTVAVSLPEKEGEFYESNTIVLNVTVTRINFAEHATAVFVDPQAEYVYSGPDHTFEPAVNVYFDQTTKLEKDTDYTVSYENNTYAGTARAVITPLDPKYYGTVELEFEIRALPAALVLSETTETIAYKEEAVVSFTGAYSQNTPQITVTDEAVYAELKSFDSETGCGEILIRGAMPGSGSVYFTQETDRCYEGTAGEIEVTVNKADHPESMPPETISVPYHVESLSNDILSEYTGWEFAPEDVGAALAVGNQAIFDAIYSGDDAEYYNTTQSEICVIREECLHEIVILDGAEPTCTEPGLTEGQMCSICGTVLVEQVEIPALGHDLVAHPGRAANCTEISWNEYVTCSRCDYTTYEEIPPLGHSYDENGFCRICGIHKDGWYKDANGIWHYVTGGVNAVGWKKIGTTWYLFDQMGNMLTGWQKSGGSWYYLKSSGAMVTGLQQISGKWYYFASGGAMLTGWQQISGKWYYFASDGAMLTGWQQISGKWYYFASDGTMLTGWQKISGKWYYFASGGAMLTGWQKISGKWYYFAFGGAMLTGWQKISGKWYYFTSGGAMVTGTQTIDGKSYTFDSSGAWIGK